MSFNDNTPKYQQIMKQIISEIILGTYTDGQKLPSIRNMASNASINANTIQRALYELECIGLIYNKRGVGRFIIGDKQATEMVQINLAINEIKEFFLTMVTLGFTDKEIISMIENF
ncbi:GntR family transcriptional regulator [Clostridium chromiireducens]|uniref:GntR family transcriptional regulator n=1 Tax=Clostridium chromiireducens TaxID=225345 RepID=UPI003AF54627